MFRETSCRGNLNQIHAECPLPHFELPQTVTMSRSESAAGSFSNDVGVAVAEPCKVGEPLLGQHFRNP